MICKTLNIHIIFQVFNFFFKTLAVFVNINDVGKRDVKMSGTLVEGIKGIGFIMCARRCETLPSCQGINYHKSNLICELLSEETTDELPIEGWWYVNKIGLTQEEGLSTGIDKSVCDKGDRSVKLSSGKVHCSKQVPIDCRNKRNRTDGIYTISPQGIKTFHVYCDLETSGGPWTVIQARVDDSVDFYRPWKDYKNGFGNLTGSFWLGNDNIHSLLSARDYTLRVDIEYWDDERYYAEYTTFKIADEDENYRLSIGGYSGNAGDALIHHNGVMFSTSDRDNDEVLDYHCATTHPGGWWYTDCYWAFLNGIYFNKPILQVEEKYDGIHWRLKKDGLHTLKAASMKVKGNL